VPVELWVADLTQPDAAEALHAHCQQAGWTVSLLINNAGIGRFGVQNGVKNFPGSWGKER
jgi:short-subunit dehydrogenase